MDVKLRKISTVLVGAGNRGCVYCDFSIEEPDRLEVLAVVEPDLMRLNEAGDKYGVPAERRFTNLKDFLDKMCPASHGLRDPAVGKGNRSSRMRIRHIRPCLQQNPYPKRYPLSHQ